MEWNNFNNGQFIFSKMALENALKIKSRYSQLVLENLEKLTGTPWPAFSPWMGLPVIIDKFRYSEAPKEKDIVRELFLSEQLFLNNNNLLSWVNDNLSETGGILGFTAGEYDVPAIIDVNCAKTKPWFEERLARALGLLKASDPVIAAFVDQFLVQVVPFVATKMDVSSRCLFSSHRLKGAVFIQYCDKKAINPLLDAIDIFHEIGHQVLIYYFTADKITSSPPDTLVYSGARRTLRPAVRSIHSAMALTYMIIAGLALRALATSTDDLDLLKSSVLSYQDALRLNIESARERLVFTQLGKILIDEMAFYASCPLKGGNNE